jgi:hypothetical protein
VSSNKHSSLPSPCNSKLFKDSSNYRGNCSNPFTSADTSSPYKHEVHHIVCEHAILDIQVDDAAKLQFIKDCLCATTWDINQGDNLIRVPLKGTYTASNGVTPQNACAHNCDHNITRGYTDEVKTWLKNNIWDTCVDQKKSHQTNTDAIQALLGTCITVFTAELTRRGIRSGGTKNAWDNRFLAGWETTWYLPFSMADDPFVTPRLPVGKWPKCLSLLG